MKNLTAIKLRLVLICSLVLLAAAGVAIFLFGYNKVKEYAVIAQSTASQASASNSSLQDLITTKKTLQQNDIIVNKVQQLVAESQRYLYQDQIISDINHFASDAGLKVVNISFADPKTTAVGTAPATTGTATTAAPNGIKSVTATITLGSPIPYSNMLNFIHLIEQSLFRMQVSQISLSQSSSDGGGSQISSDALVVEVYVR